MLENNRETNLFGEPLNLDLIQLCRLQDAGMLRIYSMRKSSELVGYCMFIVYNHVHHSHLKVANQDVIFIKKGHRGHASKFVQYCDGELKKIGVEVVLQHSPAINEWNAVLERIGYSKLETTYQRRL